MRLEGSNLHTPQFFLQYVGWKIQISNFKVDSTSFTIVFKLNFDTIFLHVEVGLRVIVEDSTDETLIVYENILTYDFQAFIDGISYS